MVMLESQWVWEKKEKEKIIATYDRFATCTYPINVDLLADGKLRSGSSYKPRHLQLTK